MALCKDCIHKAVCENVILKLTASEYGKCKHFIDKSSVVLKSEIECIDKNIEHCPLCGSYIITAKWIEESRMEHTEQGQHGDPVGEKGVNALEAIKAEVAREIFDEIEKTLNQSIKLYYTITVSTFDSIERVKARASESALRAFRDYVAELKKKYTEGK